MSLPALPHNIQVEQAILGAVLVNNDAYALVSGTVSRDDFFEPVHSLIFAEIERKIIAGQVASPVTLRDSFPDAKIGDDMTVSQYLARLAAEATTVVSAPDYARLIRDTATIRRVISIADDLRNARDHLRAPDVALREAWDELDRLRAAPETGDEERGNITKLVANLVETTREAMEGKTETVPSTGLKDVDRVVGGGYRPGRLFVGAGRPGMGKSVLMAESSRRVGRSGLGVGIFSLEIDANEVSSRIIASEMARSSVPADYRDIIAGKLEGLQPKKFEEAAQRVQEYPIEIDATAGLSMFDIKARARVWCEKWHKKGIKPAVIFIDYLGLIRASDRYRGNRVNELGEIAQGAKELSKYLKVSVFLLAQLNRAVETREDKRPLLSDLRESGQIEEHADVVTLLYRPNYYDQRDTKVRDMDAAAIELMESRKYDLDLMFEKNRLGPTIPVRLYCDIGKSSIDNRESR